MTARRFRRYRTGFGLAALLAPVLLSSISPAKAQTYFQQTNLISDVPGVALQTDTLGLLKNPWGVSFTPGSPMWVSDQVTNVTTLYNNAGTPQALVVSIPGGPTGQLFNSTGTDFKLTPAGTPSTFIFSTLGGNIYAWNGSAGTNAQLENGHAGSVYTGLTLGNNGTGNFLYAADARNGHVDVYNSTFTLTGVAGTFTDPNLPAGFAPYNVQNINGTLYVTYENRAAGGGVVDAFDLNGNLLRRLGANAAGGILSDPWGLALAPSGFGPFANDLLVGNKGDGHISAFDPLTGQFKGQLLGANGSPLTNTGLWALNFRAPASGADPNTLFFVAGINGETNGLLGTIRAVPEPGSLALLSGLAVSGSLFAIGRLRRRRK